MYLWLLGWGDLNTSGLFFSPFVSQINTLLQDGNVKFAASRFTETAATERLFFCFFKCNPAIIRDTVERRKKTRTELPQTVWLQNRSYQCGSCLAMLPDKKWRKTTVRSVYLCITHTHKHRSLLYPPAASLKLPLSTYISSFLSETRPPSRPYPDIRGPKQRRRTPPFHSHHQLPERGSSVPRVADLYPAGVWHVHAHACISPCTCNVTANRPLSVFYHLVKVMMWNTEMNASHLESTPLIFTVSTITSPLLCSQFVIVASP